MSASPARNLLAAFYSAQKHLSVQAGAGIT